MAQHERVSTLDNRIRTRRQAAGLSQQELARRCGVTRQAINAIEAGHYIPSTLVAIRLSRAHGCRVEELFHLQDAPLQMEAEWYAGAAPAQREGQRIQLARVGERLLARPLTGASAFTAADGITVAVADAPRAQALSRTWVTADLWVEPELPERTLVVLECEPALALLGAHLARRYPSFRLIWVESSSLTALRLLARGEAHAAGTHLWDPESGEHNVPYIRRELGGRRLVIITLSQWQQGLLLAAGNPKGIVGAADLERGDITMVNREPGAGSRVWLDLWLQKAEVVSAGVRGYGHEVCSHREVAEAVARGAADVGPGIQVMAGALGLDFIPLQEERYDLVIPLEFFNAPAVQALLDIAGNRAFQQELEALGGYDSSEAGTIVAELAS